MISDLSEMLRLYGARSLLLALAMACGGRMTYWRFAKPDEAERWRDLSKKLRELAEQLPGDL